MAPGPFRGGFASWARVCGRGELGPPTADRSPAQWPAPKRRGGSPSPAGCGRRWATPIGRRVGPSDRCAGFARFGAAQADGRGNDRPRPSGARDNRIVPTWVGPAVGGGRCWFSGMGRREQAGCYVFGDGPGQLSVVHSGRSFVGPPPPGRQRASTRERPDRTGDPRAPIRSTVGWWRWDAPGGGTSDLHLGGRWGAAVAARLQRRVWNYLLRSPAGLERVLASRRRPSIWTAKPLAVACLGGCADWATSQGRPMTKNINGSHWPQSPRADGQPHACGTDPPPVPSKPA